MLLYFGPEVLMPVVSAVAAALGAILVGGKRVLGWIQSGLRWVGGLVGLGAGDEEDSMEGPETGERTVRRVRKSGTDGTDDGPADPSDERPPMGEDR